jgi:hypothetical protein
LGETLYNNTQSKDHFSSVINTINVELATFLSLSFAVGCVLGLAEVAFPIFNKINRPTWNAMITGLETTLIKWIFFYFSYNALFDEAKNLNQNDSDTNITLIVALMLIGMTFGAISGIGEYRSFFMVNDDGKNLINRLRGKSIHQCLKELGKAGLALSSSGILFSASLSTIYDSIDFFLYLSNTKKSTFLSILQMVSLMMAFSIGAIIEAVNQQFPSVRRLVKKPYLISNKLIQLALFNMVASLAIADYVVGRITYPLFFISSEANNLGFFLLFAPVFLSLLPSVFFARYADEVITKFKYFSSAKDVNVSINQLNMKKAASTTLSALHRLVSSYLRLVISIGAVMVAMASIILSYDWDLVYIQPLLGLIYSICGVLRLTVGSIQAFHPDFDKKTFPCWRAFTQELNVFTIFFLFNMLTLWQLVEYDFPESKNQLILWGSSTIIFSGVSATLGILGGLKTFYDFSGSKQIVDVENRQLKYMYCLGNGAESVANLVALYFFVDIILTIFKVAIPSWLVGVKYLALFSALAIGGAFQVSLDISQKQESHKQYAGLLNKGVFSFAAIPYGLVLPSLITSYFNISITAGAIITLFVSAMLSPLVLPTHILEDKQHLPQRELPADNLTGEELLGGAEVSVSESWAGLFEADLDNERDANYRRLGSVG